MSLNKNKFNSSQKSSKYYFSQQPPPYYLFNKQKINLNNKNIQNKFNYEENSFLNIFGWHPLPQQFLALFLPFLFSLFAIALLIGAIIYLQLLNYTKLNSVSLSNEGEIGGKVFLDEKQLKRMRRQTVPADNVRVLSGESRIQLIEPHLNATIWSNASFLQMAPNGREVALSASKVNSKKFLKRLNKIS
uniref:BPH_2 domain-containing protein n=1 Tax=Meloidogyne hapla TaxID=6305 RepID=A0A1I8B3N3_MELHA